MSKICEEGMNDHFLWSILLLFIMFVVMHVFYGVA
jgi:hypothetical protein